MPKKVWPRLIPQASKITKEDIYIIFILGPKKKVPGDISLRFEPVTLLHGTLDYFKS